jgi:pyruvate kinase
MHKILVTIGPRSLNEKVIKLIEKQGVYLFRINLSHTHLENVESVIDEIRKYSAVPICLDSEGAQIRNQNMKEGGALLEEDSVVKIHTDEVLGDSSNLSFSPNYIVSRLEVDDEMTIDFNLAKIKIIEKHSNHCLAKVATAGYIGSNKASDILNRQIELAPLTEKDKRAIEIGKKKNINNFALSFAGSAENVLQFREVAGQNANIISKIESRPGLYNLKGIIQSSNAILIDRGDLSRQVPLKKIPFFQRRIISTARMQSTPVFVATNLLESMINTQEPTRAEVNDVISTLIDGANGLVLAAETAVGKYPVKAVEMIRSLINQLERWTPNTSIEELLESE